MRKSKQASYSFLLLITWICKFLMKVLSNSNVRKKEKGLQMYANLKIEEYKDILVKKYRQLAYKDDYGTIKTNKYEAELKYFMDNVVDSEKIMSKEMRSCIIEKIINYMKENVNLNETLLSVNNPYEFEQKCAQILNENGWNARATSKSLDQGVDVIAEREGITVVIQCKLYNKPVGNKAVQEIIAGRDFYKADFAVVVSNSTYTISARQLAQNCNVLLMNVDELKTLSERIK